MNLSTHVQQDIQLPLTPGPSSPSSAPDTSDFVETETHVHPIAYGYDTVLDDLRNKRIKPIMAMIYFVVLLRTIYVIGHQANRSISHLLGLPI